jgi:hypothetical protein
MERIADSSPFFRCILVLHLQFLKSGINSGPYYRKALCQFPILNFEDGSFVQFLPSIVGFHGRYLSLASRNRAGPAKMGRLLNWKVTVAILLPFGNSSSVPLRGTPMC